MTSRSRSQWTSNSLSSYPSAKSFPYFRDDAAKKLADKQKKAQKVERKG